jgi:hypothetical protein
MSQQHVGTTLRLWACTSGSTFFALLASSRSYGADRGGGKPNRRRSMDMHAGALLQSFSAV